MTKIPTCDMRNNGYFMFVLTYVVYSTYTAWVSVLAQALFIFTTRVHNKERHLLSTFSHLELRIQTLLPREQGRDNMVWVQCKEACR